MKALGLTAGIAGKRVVVQGLGNVGYHAAKICREEGNALIIAIAEREGAIMNPNGLNETDVFQHRKETGSILNFPGATNLESGAALELDCDVLIPAALENQITADNAAAIKARIIIEGANGPTTPEAENILLKKGVLIVPDVYANAGGVTVSYFEWLKNLSHVRIGRMGKRAEEANERRILAAVELLTGQKFTEDILSTAAKGSDEQDFVNSGLEDTMVVSYQRLRELWKGDSRIPDLRTAAFLDAIEKVARAYGELGIFP